MLREGFTERLKAAMRAKDARTVSTVRMILAGLKDRDIAARSDGNKAEIADPEILRLLQGMVKQRRESIALFRQGNRPDLATQEEEEIAIIESFLPRQMSDDEIAAAAKAAIAASGAAGVKDMGRVMAALRERHAGVIDLARAGAIVKQLLGLIGRQSMAFPPGFLDELRSRIALGDLVGRRVRLTRRGREQAGLCPFHNEKTPSFYVVEDKGFFHCFGCGAHGDAIGFVMRADNLDFIEAVERLAGEAGIAVPTQTPQDRERAQRQKTLLEALSAAAEFYEAQLWSPSGARAREYLSARGLDEETIRRFRLGWAGDSRENGDRQALRRALGKEFPEALLSEAGLLRTPEDSGTPYDYFRARVMFPIGDRAGRVIAFGARTLGDDQPKYLNSPDTPLFEKGRVLYGWAAARANLSREPEAPAIVVEGYMDVIALHRAGFGGAVAPLGTALTEAQLFELWRLSREPVLCFDGDTAGKRAASRALDRALPLLKPGQSLRFVTLPSGEDPDSLVRRESRLVFAQCLQSALSLSEKLWEDEKALAAIDTPERRADFETRLMEQVNRIADRSVQNGYRRYVREKLFALGRATATRLPVRSARQQPQPHVTYTVLPGVVREHKTRLPTPPPPRTVGRVHLEVFLGLFLCHPALIDEWVEEIAALDIPEPALDRLRRAILETAHAHPGLDAKTFQQHLALCGHTETLNALATTIARDGAFAARGGDDPEVIRRGLREILQLLHAQGPGDADSVWQVDSSDDDLQRLTARKERELQDGPIGGME